MSRSRPSAWTVVGVLVVTLGLLALGSMWFFSAGRAAGQAHDRALERWESKEPASYAFDWTRCDGMSARCLLHVSVTDGRVTSVTTREGDCPAYEVDEAPTIEDVFAMEERDRAGAHVASWEIEYDRTWGFPASVRIRCPDGYMDCGIGYAVTDFAPHP
jgi:hypothetical protein